jgi:SAM-dependent MidA family methyltransferase
MTQPDKQDQSSRERIGWAGDFYTAPELSPILAKTLVRQVLAIDAQLGQPPTFTVVEMGGGNGTFAADFLQHCQAIAPDFLNRLRYSLVERSLYLQSLQESRIQQVMGSWLENRVSWVNSIGHLDTDSVLGVMFSNELVDAFPVHRIRLQNQCLQEVFVDYAEGCFVEHLGPLSFPKTQEYVHRHGIALQEGQTSELHLAAEEWMTQVARVLQHGVIITIDYGHTGSDYYGADRNDGTLLCYYQHAVSKNPYTRVGEQDMTAHVNFSALAKTGKECGLLPVGFTTLANWLMGLGVDAFVQDQDPESPEIQTLSQLLRPHGMGTIFKVFVQQKGIESMSLEGLRYRAFFDDVL